MSVQATRQHFVDIQQGCIAEVMSGAVKLPSHVTPFEYFQRCSDDMVRILAGEWDHTYTFQQRKHWLETGEMIGLLCTAPKPSQP